MFSLHPALRGAWGYLAPSALTVSVVAVPVMSLPTLYMEPLAKAKPDVRNDCVLAVALSLFQICSF